MLVLYRHARGRLSSAVPQLASFFTPLFAIETGRRIPGARGSGRP